MLGITYNMCYNRKEVFKMGRVFSLWRDPYGHGFDIFKKSAIEIKPGATVLVGCNGIGKTTLLRCIEELLKEEKIPCMRFDNLIDGGSNSLQERLYRGDANLLIKCVCSSEGENIIINIENFLRRICLFIKTENRSKERWILLDAVDSGLSIDNIIYIKEKLFNIILEYNNEKEVYIVISANEYEMARGEKCFDVYNGKYITFKDYDDYRNMIIKNRNLKQKNKLKRRKYKND